MRIESGLWNKLWTEELSPAQVQNRIQKERMTLRWRRIKKLIIKKYGGFNRLHICELGCGRGDISLLTNLEGAVNTLVDYSDEAIKKAMYQFDIFGRTADFVKADIFRFSEEHEGKFDISMSFGLAEHFPIWKREEVFRIHHRLLRNRGVSIISVPNSCCLPYRVWRKKLESRGEWKFGMEIPFIRSQLNNLGRKAGFSSWRILTSSFISDLNRFLLGDILTKFFKSLEIPSILDYHLSYALTFIGYKY